MGRKPDKYPAGLFYCILTLSEALYNISIIGPFWSSFNKLVLSVIRKRIGTTVWPQYYKKKLFSYSTQLSTKLILLINVKMPTIVGILTFISMINTTYERLKAIHLMLVLLLKFISPDESYVDTNFFNYRSW